MQSIDSSVRDLVESLDVEQILPLDYAAYRPLLLDGLCFFLDHLPKGRLAEIVSRQLALPPETGFGGRVLNLVHQCPTLHKLGQIVSRDRRLSHGLRRCLQDLESVRPQTQFDDISQEVGNALGNREGVELNPHPLAEASVSVILPFTWRDGSSNPIRQGVLKVLRPGVKERLYEELEIWAELGVFLQERCEYHGLPLLDYRETLDTVRRLLKEEVRFDREQRHLVEAAAFYEDEPDVVIPRLMPFCSERVTAMERVEGGKVTDAAISGSRRERLADTLIQALIAKPFWEPEEATPFHADPHAGNLFCTPDERLAILDWTLVGRLDKQQRIDLMQMVLGGITHDASRICHAVEGLGRTRPEESRLRACVADSLREIRLGHFPGFGWSQRLLDRVAVSTGMGFPENLVLFRKALLTLSSVVADTSASASVDRIMITAGLQRFSGELQHRLLAEPDSRSFGTHVSNADLLGLLGSWPGVAAGYWLGVWQDCLELFRTGSVPRNLSRK
jgi:ubiquinone biosynthesis protein